MGHFQPPSNSTHSDRNGLAHAKIRERLVQDAAAKVGSCAPAVSYAFLFFFLHT